MDMDQIEIRINNMERHLREISKSVNTPTEKMNLMQLRIASYRKINTAIELIDKVLEMIETEFVTEIDPNDTSSSIIFLNKQQEDQHNGELDDILTAIREIRWILISPPENYQNDSVAVSNGHRNS